MRRWLAVAVLLMVLAAHLLMASGGAGAFAPPATLPPYDASWSRSGSNPILSASAAWEETAVAEVAAVMPGATWRMWYSGGWANPGIGYATSSDGIAWAKYGGNPVLGQGGSGLAGPVASARVFLNGSTFHLYGSSGSPLRSTMIHYTSSDGLAWSPASLTISLPPGCSLWGNREIWVEGATWYMLQEAFAAIWRIYLYTSADGATWSIANGGAAYGSLSVDGAAAGAWGGPRFASLNGADTPMPKPDGTNYELWYHASPVSGNLPTNIYHATTTNLFADAWTWNGPVLTHTGSGFEVDQVAGPVPVTYGGTAYLFYDGDDNPASTAKIGVATAPATH